MDLYPSEEQQSLIKVASRITASLAPESGEMLTDLAPDQWRAVADSGWFSIGIPPDIGGDGGGLADLALVFKEVGRTAVPGPLLFTALAAHVAAHTGAEFAADLMEGRMRAGVSFSSPDENPARCLVFGNGEFDVVLDIDEVACTVVLRSAVGVGWMMLDSVDPALGVRSGVLGADLGRLDGEEARKVLLRAAVLTSAVLAGNAAGTAAMSADYAKVRHQFGKPIGSFQAVSHKCADMSIRATAAMAAVDLAAVTLDEATADPESAPDLARTVAAARMFSEEAALVNARDNIQNHGAIGFTTEHTAHRYLKMARAYTQLFMPRSEQIDAIAGRPRIEMEREKA